MSRKNLDLYTKHTTQELQSLVAYLDEIDPVLFAEEIWEASTVLAERQAA